MLKFQDHLQTDEWLTRPIHPDLLFYKLLYQAISRAREKLCVLVVENYKLFSDILNIKFDMLSRYQYKENYTNTTLSVKKLNRFTKKIKDKLSELNNAITIFKTVQIFNEFNFINNDLRLQIYKNLLTKRTFILFVNIKYC